MYKLKVNCARQTSITSWLNVLLLMFIAVYAALAGATDPQESADQNLSPADASHKAPEKDMAAPVKEDLSKSSTKKHTTIN